MQCTVTVLGHNLTTTFVLIEHGGSPSEVDSRPYELIFDNGGDLTGKFVLLVSPVPIENSLRNIQGRGAVGAIVQSRQGMNSRIYYNVIYLDSFARISTDWPRIDLPPGRNMFYVTGENTNDITLVAGDVWFQDYNAISDLLNVSQNGSLTISISSFGKKLVQ